MTLSLRIGIAADFMRGCEFLNRCGPDDWETFIALRRCLAVLSGHALLTPRI
jgi:hypothetical protein